MATKKPCKKCGRLMVLRPQRDGNMYCPYCAFNYGPKEAVVEGA